MSRQRKLADKRYQEGAGAIEGLMSALKLSGALSEEYPGERHAKGYHFLGPGTKLDLRRADAAKGAFTPINKVDAAAKVHDLAYEKLGKERKAGKVTEVEALDEAHDADQDFLDTLEAIPGINFTKQIALKSIILKRFLEKKRLLSPKIFSLSGSGALDSLTTHELGAEMMKEYFDPAHKLKKKMRGKGQRGGFAAILPFLIPIVTGLAVEAGSAGIKALVKHFSGKGMKGSGVVSSDPVKQVLNVLDDLPPAEQIDKVFSLIKDEE